MLQTVKDCCSNNSNYLTTILLEKIVETHLSLQAGYDTAIERATGCMTS